MKEVTEILRLLVKAIEQNTVNTYQEQGSAAADVVFRILEDAEKLRSKNNLLLNSCRLSLQHLNKANTSQDHGSASADAAFRTQEHAEKRIYALDHPTEKDGSEE